MYTVETSLQIRSKMYQDYNKHFLDKSGKFSAEKFWEYMESEGDTVKCDETHPNFWQRDEEMPEFYDAIKFKRAQAFFQEYKASMVCVSMFGLIAILNDPFGTKILLNTGKSSDSYSAYKRYIGTLRHVLIWYSSDCSPDSKAWQSVLKIKRMHNAASNKAVKDGLYRINQGWMSETLFGFMGLALSRPDRFGLGAATNEEFSSLVHFWRVIGWMMGIEDRFNICRESLEETQAVCNMFIDKYLGRWIYIRDPSSYKLQMSVIEGLATVLPMDTKLTCNFVLELIERPSQKNQHLFFKTDNIQEIVRYMFHYMLKQMEITAFRRVVNACIEYFVQGLMEDEITDRIFAGRTAFIMFS